LFVSPVKPVARQLGAAVVAGALSVSVWTMSDAPALKLNWVPWPLPKTLNSAVFQWALRLRTSVVVPYV